MTYLGGYPDDFLWDRIIRAAGLEAGLDMIPMPEGVRIRDTQNHRFYFNYSNEPRDCDGFTLPPAGVRWCQR
jgi:beta-galactosidase